MWHHWWYANATWQGQPAAEASSSALRPPWPVFHAQASLVGTLIKILARKIGKLVGIQSNGETMGDVPWPPPRPPLSSSLIFLPRSKAYYLVKSS